MKTVAMPVSLAALLMSCVPKAPFPRECPWGKKRTPGIFVIADQKIGGDPISLSEKKTDNRILSIALFLKKQDPLGQVELITKDINLRIKADVFGISARDYEPEKVPFEEMYTGYKEITLSSDLINQFYREKILALLDKEKFFANQYILAKDASNKNHSALGRYDEKQKAMVPLVDMNEGVWGIHPRNVEQSFALDGLLNDDILFVSLVGKAGTGKTLLALAAGLYKTLDEGRFQKTSCQSSHFSHGSGYWLFAGRCGRETQSLDATYF